MARNPRREEPSVWRCGMSSHLPKHVLHIIQHAAACKQDSLCMCDTIEVTAAAAAVCEMSLPPEFWQRAGGREGEPQSSGQRGNRWRSVFTRVANLPPCHHPALACILILQPLSCAIVLSHHRGFSPKFTLYIGAAKVAKGREGD